jgi:hypothetical protein
LAAVKHILRYVARIVECGLFYPRGDGGELTLKGYSDLAGDVDSRRSTTGIMFFLCENPVSWQSTKQRLVAVSSCEAEYVAAASASC